MVVRLGDVKHEGRNSVIEWLFAGLNSVELASVPWSIFMFSGDTESTPGRKNLDAFLESRLKHMNRVLTDHEWLAGAFSVADIVMADALRLVGRFSRLEQYEACREYIARATARPAFLKAYEDQMAFYTKADLKGA